jgi:hypothetical protein
MDEMTTGDYLSEFPIKSVLLPCSTCPDGIAALISAAERLDVASRLG